MKLEKTYWKKVALIIKREYLSKVKKRSFIIMTILGPILIAGFMVLAIYLGSKQTSKALVHVIDETGLIAEKLENTPNYTFIQSFENVDSLKNRLVVSGVNYNLLYIPKTKLNVPENGIIYSNEQPSFNLQSYISNSMNREIEKVKLEAEISNYFEKNSGDSKVKDTNSIALLSQNILKNIKTNVKITTFKTDEKGAEKESHTAVSMGIGYAMSLLIYMFIFMYGAQVMNGVIEEKTSRIVEVIVSSIKPMQLMLGKIIGIALVGLTQFVLWIVLTFVLISAAQIVMPQASDVNALMETTTVTNPVNTDISATALSNPENDILQTVLSVVQTLNIPVLVISFILYFLLGYLLYAALFAAIGSAVENETDSQQFMFPITIPLFLGIILAQNIIQNPSGSLAMWLSMIPFTSPIAMVTRIPFGIPYWQIAVSLGLLVLGFFGATWLAGKIYRTGILMYGKKSSYKELWKWIRYKN